MYGTPETGERLGPYKNDGFPSELPAPEQPSITSPPRYYQRITLAQVRHCRRHRGSVQWQEKREKIFFLRKLRDGVQFRREESDHSPHTSGWRRVGFPMRFVCFKW